MNERIRLSLEDLADLFKRLDRAELSAKDIAVTLGVHVRTLRDWRRGKFTIPKIHFETILRLAGTKEQHFGVQEVSRWWYTKEGGLRGGHKLRAGLDIPAWVLKDRRYAISSLRGIFDTDGSIFLETHKRKNKTYSYPRLSLVSKSRFLRETVAYQLIDLGIQAEIRGERSVSIEHFTDIEKYFKIIGSSNPKHLERWATFGGVG